MTARKAQLVGLAAVLTLSVTGCGIAKPDSGTAAAAPGASSAPADPRDVLLAAMPGEQDGPFHFDVAGGDLPMSGVLDAPKKALEIKISQKEPEAGFTLAMTTRMIGEQTWVKMAFSPASVPGLPKISKKWQLLDPKKTKDQDLIGYDGSTDPGSAAAVVEKSEGVEETSPGHFTGTTDLTAVPDDADILDEATSKALGDKAKAVPFEAVVAEGHLTGLTVKIPAAGTTKAKNYVVRYSGFGSTATVSVPAAGEQQKASAVIYQMLEG